MTCHKMRLYVQTNIRVQIIGNLVDKIIGIRFCIQFLVFLVYLQKKFPSALPLACQSIKT